jgi:signal transduction histidine kinase
MSATASTQQNFNEGQATGESLSVRVLFYVVTAIIVSTLAMGIARSPGLSASALAALVVWIIVAAIADLLPVQLWGDVSLSMSLPVTLAAGMVMVPWQAGLVAFIAAVDLREFRGEVGLARGLYNRSQVAASVMIASLAFHALGGSPEEWPAVIVFGLVALSVDWAANSLLVMVPVAMLTRLPASEVLRRVYGSSPREHTLGYVCLGLLAVLLAAIYGVAQGWGLVAFLIPLVMARQVFMRGRRLEEATLKLDSKDRALLSTSEQTLAERRDERMAVAGELHDEVLPPLFKVHLMGQVLRQDLNSGRLLDLDEDLPELLTATEAAQSAIRDLVRDLRRSSLGPGGLNTTLELLANQLEAAGSPSIDLSLSDVGGSSLSQLLIYQVAREALNNAARHSRASRIAVFLYRDDGLIRLVVEDDGIGFDASQVDRDAHFGLQLISERIEAGRGRVVIDSRLGAGTRVMATLPPELNHST